MGLSAPFVGDYFRVIVMLGKEMKEGQWSGYKHLKHHHFKVYLNPKISDTTAATTTDWEESVGYPGIRMLM